MTLDVALLRLDTPGVANVLHFNNAGAALPPRPVLDAVTSHLAREAAIGGYEAAASLHYYNDESEVERFVRAVAD